MTKGSIYKQITLFAIPIFLGQLLQQLYNVVDSIIVGNFVGSEALAAVTSSGSLIFLIVGFITGLFMGASVIIGNKYGAKDYDGVHRAVHTSIAFGLISGIVMTLFGIFCTPLILRLMGTPADVMPNSVLYFRVYFLGGLAIVMYNTCCGIFQAVGDSKRPLYYLVLSAVVNTILDLVFVAVLNMGVGGAALATVLAQFLSALMAFIKLIRIDGPHKIILKDIKMDGSMLLAELKLGIPTGIQNSVIAIANVIVQSNINAFGSLAMAGSGSYFKLEGFAFLPITSFCQAITTFTSQNLGANNIERAKKGARFGIFAGVFLAEIIGVIFFFFMPSLALMFSSDERVIAYAVKQSHTETLFYFALSYSHCMASVLRGAQKTTVPMYVMLAVWCVFRISYITIAVHFIPEIVVIYMAYPITWMISSVIFTIYYKKVDIFQLNLSI